MKTGNVLALSSASRTISYSSEGFRVGSWTAETTGATESIMSAGLVSPTP